MKNLLLFPYHPDIEPMLYYKDCLANFSISGICSYKEDASLVQKINIMLNAPNSFDELLASTDAVLILDNYRECKYDKYYAFMQQATARNKDILITPKAYQTLDANKLPENYTVLKNAPDLNLDSFKKLAYIGRKKYIIETPAIAVIGMGKNCEKFKTQLLLKNYYESNGYNCAWIASNPLGALFGGYTFPDFMCASDISFDEKILRLNDFLYKLTIIEQPDVLIVGVPEGISEFSVDEFNHFGEYPLVVGNAVPIDSAILCTYFMNIQNFAGADALCRRCLSKFNIPVKALSIGSVAFESVEGADKIEYTFLEKSYLEKYYVECASAPIPIFPSWDKSKGENTTSKLLDGLACNADAI